ncbi:MAG: thioredoxin family protein [Thermoguttaceae bacterium]|nr:thioredoxin family protein [Thermoguttaceae bacterium]
MITNRKYIFIAAAAIALFFQFSSSFGFPWDNAPKKEIQWSDNLKQALELSRQTGKPVLLHFYSDTCPPCRMMEKNTFPNPAIVDLVEKSFIPVKLNSKQYAREAQMFNVQYVPTDIVLTPDGQTIDSKEGGQDVSRYSLFLATAQEAAKPYMAKYVNNGQVGTASISGSKVNHHQQQASNQFPAPPAIENPPAVPTNIQPGGACPINETPSFDYASIPEEDRARIEFEGYCPVELGLRSMWVRGDYNTRQLFEGRLYLFAGKAQQEEFNRNPEKYAPAYQGIDIVIWKERGEKVQGSRSYGAWAVGRVFLFSSEESLIKFEQNARYYLTPNKN